MSLSDLGESGVLSLLFTNTGFANVGDATGLRGSTTAGSFYISLHTADPGDSGSQTTSEATFTGYARVAVARATGGGGFSVSGTAPTTASNVSAITYPACTGGSSTCTYFGIGTASTGAGNLIASGALTASLAVSNGITVSFAAGALTITAD